MCAHRTDATQTAQDRARKSTVRAETVSAARQRHTIRYFVWPLSCVMGGGVWLEPGAVRLAKREGVCIVCVDG